MTLACAIAPDAAGVALRLSAYLDCEGRALGENGFAAVAGGVVGAGLLTGIVTIFVALIGYRLILGPTPTLRDGVSWALRLGFVLALATSWPVFQTLIYRVAADGPDELATVLLPAAGLPTGATAERIQSAYDTLRLGTEAEPQPAPAPASAADGAATSPSPVPPRPRAGQPPLPQTASLLVVFTAGVGGALRIALGVLLALGPLVVLGLLFDATLGLVSGWLRALGGTALALLAASIVTALELTVIDDQLGRITALGGFDPATFDPQALSTIVLFFALVMPVATIAASRAAGAIRLPVAALPWLPAIERPAGLAAPVAVARGGAVGAGAATSAATERPARAAAVADAVTAMARRQGGSDTSAASASAPPRIAMLAPGRREADRPATPLGLAGRRAQPRRSRTAMLRDRRR